MQSNLARPLSEGIRLVEQKVTAKEPDPKRGEETPLIVSRPYKESEIILSCIYQG